MYTKFQVEIRIYDFAEKVAFYRENSLKKPISRSRFAMGTSYFRFVSLAARVIILTQLGQSSRWTIHDVPL